MYHLVTYILPMNIGIDEFILFGVIKLAVMFVKK